ncbi:MAG: UDP-N-acetylglucosamine--N-acetylmuramyl-(pentapeptide) pyrophosphoryl-undecaprenol N-acetylglucosamine transferase [Planctomycetota bacterium]
MLKPPHLLFAGGGSLGYLHPGLSIAEELRQRTPGVRVSFAGDGRPIERQTIRAAGHGYFAIPGRQQASGPWSAVRYATDNALGHLASRWLLKEHDVSLVVGLGGHASEPFCHAAYAWGLPFVLYEQNAEPAPATRRLAEKADIVCLAVEQAACRVPFGACATITGATGRPKILSLNRLRGRADRSVARASIPETPVPTENRRLVVLGGAGGARSLNEAMPRVAAQLREPLAGWTIVHQTGEGQFAATEKGYRDAGVDAVVVTYIDELADLLMDTDLVICRASGCTLAEMALAVTPAIVVPDSRALYGTQRANADLYAAAGACEIVDESMGALTPELAQTLGSLVSSPARLETMSRAASDMVWPGAAERIASACCDSLGLTDAVSGVSLGHGKAVGRLRAA